jgi:signal transduction histidine kinase
MSSKPDTTILIVDDSPENLLILNDLLRPHYRVIAADSGEAGLRLAASQPPPDLILLDVMMPGVDGYAVLAQLQENPDTSEIPVMFLTALADPQDEERGLELGAADYINKPIKPAVVLARVSTQLENKRTRDWMKNQNAALEAEVSRRVAEKHALQSKLLQSEKLASIGLLVAGIAHEINTPVGFVNSNLGTLRDYAGDLLKVLGHVADALETDVVLSREWVRLMRERLKDIDFEYLRQDLPNLLAESREGLDRVKKIVADLKNFAHADSDEWQAVDLNAGLQSTLNLVGNELKYKVSIDKALGALPLVNCNPGRINQVFMNLLVNAGQAITEHGTITLKTWEDGGLVYVMVRDTGCGIPGDLLGRIFDPFFTTKPVGKGTGLGLSLAWGIVHGHGGHIDVDSTVGIGTTFTVILPVAGLAGATAD